MAAPTVAELKAQAEHLDRRETELGERENAITDRLAAVEQRETELYDRELELNSTPVAADTPLVAPAGVTYATLPDPRKGHGYVIVEAPLPLVAVFANLHPSERISVAAQMAGTMRQTLVETGKLGRGRGRAEPTGTLPELAILAAGDAPVEA